MYYWVRDCPAQAFYNDIIHSDVHVHALELVNQTLNELKECMFPSQMSYFLYLFLVGRREGVKYLLVCSEKSKN